MILISVFSFWDTVLGFLVHRSGPPTLDVDVAGSVSLLSLQVTDDLLGEAHPDKTRPQQPLSPHPLWSYLLSQ